MTLLAEIVTASREVAATSSRSGKIATLAALLHRLEAHEVPIAVGFLSGVPRQGRVGIGYRIAFGVEHRPAAEPTLTVDDLDCAISAIEAATGTGSAAERRRQLGGLLGRAPAVESEFIRRLLTGELRQGASGGLMADAVAKAAGVPAALVRRALMFSGDLPRTAEIATTDGERGLRGIGLEIFRPVMPMLAATAAGIEDALTGFECASVEWKLDGIRIQVHRRGDEVRVYTRNLNEITHALPGIVETVRRLPVTRAVLDGEALWMSDAGPAAFQETASQIDGDAPPEGIVTFLFDVLHVDGDDLVDTPLVQRAARLQAIAPALKIPGALTADARCGQRVLDAALRAGHEGVVVKDAGSAYAAGRRGKAWLKVKPVRTYDLVVLAAEWGHGRRRGWLSNLHLGARDPASGGYVMVGKCFKGLTDEMLECQTAELLGRETARRGIACSSAPSSSPRSPSMACRPRPAIPAESRCGSRGSGGTGRTRTPAKPTRSTISARCCAQDHAATGDGPGRFSWADVARHHATDARVPCSVCALLRDRGRSVVTGGCGDSDHSPRNPTTPPAPFEGQDVEPMWRAVAEPGPGCFESAAATRAPPLAARGGRERRSRLMLEMSPSPDGHTQSSVTLGTDPVSARDTVRVARHGAPVVISPAARQRLIDSWRRVAALAESEAPVYGVSTGFGALSTTRIPRERWGELQESLILSHAAGMGPPVEREVVRALMFLRARTLARGFSGVRPEVVDTIVGVLNSGYTPVVPEYGSLGASGDLAPLAHASLVLLGRGEVTASDGTRHAAAVALDAAGCKPLVLGPKEGLSLINGTDGMLGMLVLGCEDFELLCRTADVVAAMSVEALLGTDAAFEASVNELRPHPGQLASASNLHRVMAASAIVASHREHDDRVQDAYSMRCAPQVTGAARDVLDFARRVSQIELGSAIDNPSVLGDGRIVSNGNFHGVPLGFAADFLAIASAEVGSIAERRVDRLLDATRSMGLPPFLAETAGVDSGLMIAQYTAAALVAENRRLASPASVDSIPTSGMQEDHVSMGWAAARKLRHSLDNLSSILGIELTCAARALALRSPLRPSPASEAVMRLVDQRPGPDRVLAPELARADQLVRSGAVLDAVTAVIGSLR